jgi:hypothetical protein
MKTTLMILGGLFLFMAALATPVSIGVGIYDWVIVDLEFKFALWEGFKLWMKMLGFGLVIGYPLYISSVAIK